ncbi:MAG TPA: acyl carrier protein [Clostridiales bacterium]|jgi:acyl carrier protein|nr:acyl carrier protein [Candidatus Apopatosoma intestinale]CCZ21135.1 acyl carrier protein [Candidatus Apopatosoma intestinale]HBO65666.1 acyl carrier protein [Candidatus Apopatosoma intestinale]
MTALETVKDILSKQLRVDIDSITEDTNIMEDLGADSLDIVEMLMNIEQDYGIVIADDDIVGFKTVGDIVRYIENNQ